MVEEVGRSVQRQQDLLQESWNFRGEWIRVPVAARKTSERDTTDDEVRMVIRSTRLRSSRTFPGQDIPFNASSASGANVILCAESSARNELAKIGMSSCRSRRDGSWIGKTLSR